MIILANMLLPCFCKNVYRELFEQKQILPVFFTIHLVLRFVLCRVGRKRQKRYEAHNTFMSPNRHTILREINRRSYLTVGRLIRYISSSLVFKVSNLLANIAVDSQLLSGFSAAVFVMLSVCFVQPFVSKTLSFINYLNQT